MAEDIIRAHSDSSGLNPIDDWGKAWDNYLNGLANQFGNWVGGRQTQDPNGNHVQIGGQFNWNIFNPPGNALTMDGVIHFADENTYADYLLDPHWQNHEEGHIAQNMTWWKLPSYGFCAFVGAELESKYHLPPSQGGPLGHNYNFWEWDAERYAVQKEGQ